jgi:hypothetical protein
VTVVVELVGSAWWQVSLSSWAACPIKQKCSEAVLSAAQVLGAHCGRVGGEAPRPAAPAGLASCAGEPWPPPVVWCCVEVTPPSCVPCSTVMVLAFCLIQARASAQLNSVLHVAHCAAWHDASTLLTDWQSALLTRA